MKQSASDTELTIAIIWPLLYENGQKSFSLGARVLIDLIAETERKPVVAEPNIVFYELMH